MPDIGETQRTEGKVVMADEKSRHHQWQKAQPLGVNIEPPRRPVPAAVGTGTLPHAAVHMRNMASAGQDASRKHFLPAATLW